MKALALQMSNAAVCLLLALILAGLQSALWLQLFGWLPSPHLWMTALTYWALHRRLAAGVGMAYAMTLVVGSMTAEPLPHLLVANLATVLAVVILKRRVYWSGSTFFMLAMAVATTTWLLALSLLSAWQDLNPSWPPPLIAWLVSVLFTTVLSLPLLAIYRFLDRLFNLEAASGFEGGWLE